MEKNKLDKLLKRNITFTIEELSNYDGTNGKKAYVGVEGIVYDVTNLASWGKGTHFGNFAGMDLTKEFISCHNDKTILDNAIKVGTLKNN